MTSEFDETSSCDQERLSWTYQIKVSHAHVNAALKMNLLVIILPRAVIQNVITMSTQHSPHLTGQTIHHSTLFSK